MTKPKKKIKPVKAWAVITTDWDGYDSSFVQDVGLYIYAEDSKIFADKFAEARGKKYTKVIPVLITPITKPSKH